MHRLRAASLLGFLVVAFYALPASAHHVASNLGIAYTEPLSYVEVEMLGAKFDVLGASGEYVEATPTAEYSLNHQFSFSLRAPVAWIQRDDGTSTAGLGDMTVAASAALVRTPHGGLLLSAGLGAELPTGSVERGLGGGHFEADPFLTASTSPIEHLVFYGRYVDALSLEGHHGGGEEEEEGPGGLHGALIAPHTDHELHARHGVALAWGSFYADLRNDLVLLWTGPEALGPVRFGADVGWLFGDNLRVRLGADVPVTASSRAGLRAGLSAAWLFKSF